MISFRENSTIFFLLHLRGEPARLGAAGIEFLNFTERCKGFFPKNVQISRQLGKIHFIFAINPLYFGENTEYNRITNVIKPLLIVLLPLQRSLSQLQVFMPSSPSSQVENVILSL